MSYIKELHRYPVKSMLGEQLTTTQVDANGFPGDRAWSLRHSGSGITGKKFPAMMSARASFSEAPSIERRSAPITITLPNGDTCNSSEESMNSWLGEYLEHPAELWPLVDPADTEFYRRRASSAKTPEAMDAELRAVFSRLPDEPLPDLTTFPAELFEYDTPPGTYFDAYPLLIMSTNSLATLTANAPQSAGQSNHNFDQRRFRPNIVLDDFAGDAGFPENALVGKKIRFGEVTLDIEIACPRCIMTTHPIAPVQTTDAEQTTPNAPKDAGIMRQLVQQNDGNLGVYARIVTGGVINEGDTLEVINA